MINPYTIHTISENGKVFFAGFPVTKVVKNGCTIKYFFNELFLGETGIF